MKEVKVLRGMMVDMRGDNADMSSRLSASEAKMGEVIEAKMGEVIEKLQKHKENEFVKDDLAKLTERYGDLESSNHQLQTQFDQLQARYNEQLNSTCNPVTENPEDRKKRLKRLCETDGFTWDDGVCGGVCYYLSTSTETKSWDESRRFCTARQADLIIINSQEKKDFAVRVVGPSGMYVWIGLSDRDTEGSYKWVDGKPLSSPTFWWSGYGTPREANDCGLYYPHNGYYDYPCSYSARWMCERVVQ